ncbi:hypothetical protein K503DRAFT_863536 [Rhizopogon vinicolor AM-OR11-026]|uniref:Uncharacterized protein n=1 Tax=Rhizopogon vinicolor AM-OR11-026 TaxID=1314800 RepID=A0A1B7NAE6_9AGAM|nr:hypothetical protein K503DRAFT_863536 [Rhizopogon vinicolor AM-OR11-026]
MEDNLPWTHSPFTAGQYTPPPTLEEAATALENLKLLIQPRRPSCIGHKDSKPDLLLRSRLEKMRMFLWNYAKPIGAKWWQAASLMTADSYGKSTWLAGRLRQKRLTPSAMFLLPWSLFRLMLFVDSPCAHSGLWMYTARGSMGNRQRSNVEVIECFQRP